MIMTEPDFLVCMQCDTPCYIFEWDDDKFKPREVLCITCGNDESADFETDEEYNGGEE
jgi:Zn ribbon nucleic-acid-binding protein